MIKNIGMLQQLFDTLYAMMHEEVLLLKLFENTHLNNCHTIKNEANEFLGSVGKFIPELQKSKVCFFCHLSALDFHSYCSSFHTNSLHNCNRNPWTIIFLAQREQFVPCNPSLLQSRWRSW